jgi:hypothetical protein
MIDISKTVKSALAAVTLGAVVVASVTPASAQWRGHRGGGNWGPGIAAGVIGGLALGALATRPAYGYGGGYGYAEPVYSEPVETYPSEAYYPACHKVRQPIYDANGYHVRDRLVRVCDR